MPNDKDGVAVRNACVGCCVRRILFDCLLEIPNTLLESFLRPLIPKKATLQVELISLGAFGGAPGQPVALRRRQFEAQLFRYLFRDLFLHREYVGKPPAVVLSPEL